jgi:hypothetical protein
MAEERGKKRKPSAHAVNVGGKRTKLHAHTAGTTNHRCDLCRDNNYAARVLYAKRMGSHEQIRTLLNPLIQDHKPQIHNAGALVQCRLPRQEGKYNACDTIWFLNCFEGNLGVLQHICNCDIDSMDRFSRIGNTSICYAIAGSVNGHNLAVVEWLVNGYISSSKEHTADMMTCFLTWTVHCAGLGDIQILQFFVELCKESNMDVRDYRGYTPLLNACVTGNKHAVQLLQQYCKKCTRNDHGNGMVAVAIQNGRLDLLRWMIDDKSHGPKCLMTVSFRTVSNVFHVVVRVLGESPLAVLEWLLSLPPKYEVPVLTSTCKMRMDGGRLALVTPFSLALCYENLPAAKLLYKQHCLENSANVCHEWLLAEGYKAVQGHAYDDTFKWLVETFPSVLETACVHDLQNSSASVRSAYYELLFRRYAKPRSLSDLNTAFSATRVYKKWNEDVLAGETLAAAWRGFMLSELSFVRQPDAVSELILQYMT